MSALLKRFQGAGSWVLFILLVWLPLEWLYLAGLQVVQETTLESRTALIRLQLTTDLMRFRDRLRPEEVLTRLWRDARSKVVWDGDPERWFQQARAGLGAFPPEAFDLYLTDGRRVIPEFPGYDAAPLGSLLASLTYRARSLEGTAQAVEFVRSMAGDLRVMGGERHRLWKWVDLPRLPGISNQVFNRYWDNHRVTSVLNTPRNSYAAFGPLACESSQMSVPADGRPGGPLAVGSSAGSVAGGAKPVWRYLLLFHRHRVDLDVLRQKSWEWARTDGIEVEPAILETDLAARKILGGKAAGGGELRREGRRVTLTEFDERLGPLTAGRTLPLEVWSVWLLGQVVNLAFSLVGLAMAWRFAHGASWDDLPVGRKILLGLSAAAGLPVILAVIGSQGAAGAHLFQRLQSHQKEMEQRLDRLEEEFDRFMAKQAVLLRKEIKGIRTPITASQAARIFDRIHLRFQTSTLQLFQASDGKRIIAQGPTLWSVPRTAARSPAKQREQLARWMRRGFSLAPFELAYLSVEGTGTVSLREAIGKAFQRSRGRDQVIQVKVMEVVAKTICRACNLKTIDDFSLVDGNSKTLLNLFFSGREMEFLHEILSRLGQFQTFKIAGYQGLTLLEVVRDARQMAQGLVFLVYRFSDANERFFLHHLSRRNEELSFRLMAIAMFAGNLDIGRGIHPETTEWLRGVMDTRETAFRTVLPDERGEPSLVSVMRGRRMPDYLLVGSLPLSRLDAEVRGVRNRHLLGLGILFLMLICAVWWLRALLLVPLTSLSQRVGDVSRGRHDVPPAEPGVGEIGQVAEIFNRSLDTLRQMDMAKVVQEGLLPRQGFTDDHYEIFGSSTMLTQVGGDYFDLLPQPDGRCLVAVGDVTGHGLPAAIIMATVKAGLSVLAGQEQATNEICRRLSELLFRLLSRKKMMTCFLAALDRTTHQLSYTNAGHNFPLLLKADGTSLYLKQTNLPLGAMRSRVYKIDSVPMAPGETLIILTDGVLEAKNPVGEIIGYDTFQRFAERLRGLSPARVIEEVFAFTAEHTAGRPRDDDLTILVLRRRL